MPTLLPTTPARPLRPIPREPIPRKPIPRKPSPREQAEALIEQVRLHKRQAAETFYELGVALRELSAPPMYRALGYETFDELLTKRRLVARMQAYKLIEVVEAFSREQALQLGIEKAYALVRYVAATPAQDIAAELARRDAAIGGSAISQLSARKIAAATKKVRAPAVDEAEARHARDRARRLQRKLRAQGAKQASVRAVRRSGRWWLQIALPLGDDELLFPA